MTIIAFRIRRLISFDLFYFEKQYVYLGRIHFEFLYNFYITLMHNHLYVISIYNFTFEINRRWTFLRHLPILIVIISINLSLNR